MDILLSVSEKINKLRINRGWSIYRLAKETGISTQTIHNWFNLNSTPSIKNLYEVCEAFGITMSEFFAENKLVEVTDEIKDLHNKWCALTEIEKTSIKAIVDSYTNKK